MEQARPADIAPPTELTSTDDARILVEHMQDDKVLAVGVVTANTGSVSV